MSEDNTTGSILPDCCMSLLFVCRMDANKMFTTMTDPAENDSIPVEGRRVLSDNDLENVVGGAVRGRVHLFYSFSNVASRHKFLIVRLVYE